MSDKFMSCNLDLLIGQISNQNYSLSGLKGRGSVEDETNLESVVGPFLKSVDFLGGYKSDLFTGGFGGEDVGEGDVLWRIESVSVELFELSQIRRTLKPSFSRTL